jgi:peptide/nickel transport system substrate-binding protein
VARGAALAAAIAVALLAVSGAGGAGAQTPKRGGTLEIVVAFEPPCLNFLLEKCSGGIFPGSGVLAGAFRIGPDLAREPWLVSRVDYTTKPPFTLTYHIRAEARWSDGVPITARDFLFTYKAGLNFPPAAGDNPYQTIRRIRALDPKTVRVVLRSRYAFWRDLFQAVLPEHALRRADLSSIWIDRMDDPRTGRPIASGPFLFDTWERGKRLTLRRNTRCWGPHAAYLGRIAFRYTLDPAVAAELFRQGADLGIWQFNADLADALERVPGVRILVAPDAPGWEHLDIRMRPPGHPALRKKLVRRALAFGVDRVEIVRAVFGEAARGVLRPLDNALFRSSFRSYRPNWKGYRYRPAEARRLLERAGCRRGADGIYSCEGQRLSLRFVSRGTLGRRVQTLELVQAQLRRAGIHVVPVYAPSTAHNQVLETGDFDVTMFAWFSNGAEGAGIKDLFGCGGPGNYMGYCQRLVTRDLDQADRIFDQADRTRVLNRADAQIAKDVPTIPLFEVPSVTAVRSTVRGLGRTNFFDPTWKGENWWLER